MRKVRALFLFNLLLLAGCSNDIASIHDYHLVRTDLHIGEYVQVFNEDIVITPSRAEPVVGLVAINLKTEEVKVLDDTAGEARDLYVSDEFIAYRLGTEVRLIKDEKKLKLPLEVERLRSFIWFGDWGRITYDSAGTKTNNWMTFKNDGTIISSGSLKGSARFSIRNADQEYIFQQSPSGLLMSIFNSPEKGSIEDIVVIPGQSNGAYVSARILFGVLYIVSFDENTGVLKIASRPPDSRNFSVTDVDGTENKTYRGLDPTIFDDNGKPGIIYLDGWALRLRMARLRNNKWVSEELPYRGSTGFYTKVVSENKKSANIVFHNFRSTLNGIEQTFEDMAYAKINK